MKLATWWCCISTQC